MYTSLGQHAQRLESECRKNDWPPPAGPGRPSFAEGQSANFGVSAACGHPYVQNVIKIDGDVNFPAAVTVPQIAAMPGQQILNITYLNQLAETFSETGRSLWTVLSTAAGGIKVPAAEFVATAAETGMRRNELLALKWTNIDFATATVTVCAECRIYTAARLPFHHAEDKARQAFVSD
jgi:hypothetical protein